MSEMYSKAQLKLIDLFVWFIAERYYIYVRKESGEPKPWTTDIILQNYKFCNVHRENDRVTIWIRENWREPFRDDPDLWFAMVVARLINWPDTLQRLTAMFSSGVAYKPARFLGILHAQKARGAKVFGAAYIVSTNGRAMDKAEYVVYHVLPPLWRARRQVRPRKGEALEAFYLRLRAFDGLGSFLAAQVVADMKYTPLLQNAPDWMSFAASGPGSRRGLNRVLARPVDAPWTESAWQAQLAALSVQVLEHPAFKKLMQRMARAGSNYGLEPLHAQDLQNCLCEFDKYMRTKLGQGTPKCLYNGRKD